ncbi:MAG: hypothetical protein JNK15_07350 [Planctomycetes bacterium]|nr:hypothetical protein [Planctomycetota bacterium]
MNFGALVELVPRLLGRAFASDFQRHHAADDERTQLAAAPQPVQDPLAQDYVAWRRAVLWVSGVLLALGALIAAIEHRSVAEQAASAQAAGEGRTIAGVELQQVIAQLTQNIGPSNLAILDGLQEFLLFVKIACAVLTLAAAWQWLRIRRSRALARWGWLVVLALPLLVSAWPWGQSLDFSHLERNQFGQAIQNSALVKQQVALAIAAVLLSTIAPKLVALFPGIMRSSLCLKTLLPEASAPGWLAVVFAPFLVGFLLLFVCFLSQVQGSWLLLGGIAGLAFGPILYVRKAAELVRPHTAAEVGAVVGRVRSTAGFANVIGVALLTWYLFDLDEIGWANAIHLLLEAAGGLFLTMVVIGDVTLALLAFSQRQSAQFQGSDLRAQYEQRLQALAGAGLTDVEGALGMQDLARLRQVGRS